jgi:hypothetical protein
MIMPRTKGNLKNYWPLANNGKPDRQRLYSPLADFFHNIRLANGCFGDAKPTYGKLVRLIHQSPASKCQHEMNHLRITSSAMLEPELGEHLSHGAVLGQDFRDQLL